MKRIIGLLLMVVVAVFVTFGCGGGGGGGSSDTPTPAGTAFSMAILKGVNYGTATPGTQISFKLAGSDSQKNSYTVSYAIVSDGATTFESQNVNKSRTLITLQVGTGTPATIIVSDYYLTSNSTLYKSISTLGYTCVPITQTVIPDTIHVGDFDNFMNDSCSDGTTNTYTWRLEADYNGNSRFVISSIEKTGATVTSNDEETFYLDSSGNPYKMAVKSTDSTGDTLTLSGNRN